MDDDAAIIDDVAAAEAESIAEDAAVIADEAAVIDDEADESAIGVVVDIEDEAGDIVLGVVVVVVVDVSSFLLQAAKETAAARVAISRAAFMGISSSGGFDIAGSGDFVGNPLQSSPRNSQIRNAGALSNPTDDYRRIRGFP